jgi:hypothetical protein
VFGIAERMADGSVDTLNGDDFTTCPSTGGPIRARVRPAAVMSSSSRDGFAASRPVDWCAVPLGLAVVGMCIDLTSALVEECFERGSHGSPRSRATEYGPDSPDTGW